jgi:hypothetical protein
MPKRSETTVKDFRNPIPLCLFCELNQREVLKNAAPSYLIPLYCCLHQQYVQNVVLNSIGRLRYRPHYSVSSVSEFLSKPLTSSSEHAPGETGTHAFPGLYKKIIFGYFT